jgi:hypothetical protein
MPHVLGHGMGNPNPSAKTRGKTCFKIWEQTLSWTVTARSLPGGGTGMNIEHVDKGPKEQYVKNETHCIDMTKWNHLAEKDNDGSISYKNITFNLMGDGWDNPRGGWNKTLGPYTALSCRLVVDTGPGGSYREIWKGEAEIMHERQGKRMWTGDPAANPYPTEGFFGGWQEHWLGYDPEDWEEENGIPMSHLYPGANGRSFSGFGKYEQAEFVKLRADMRKAINDWQNTNPVKSERENWIFYRDLKLRVPYFPPNYDTDGTGWANALWVPRLNGDPNEPLAAAETCPAVALYCQNAPYHQWGGGQPPTVPSMIPQMNYGYYKIVATEDWDNMFHPLEMKGYLSNFLSYCAHWATAYLMITPKGGNMYYSNRNGYGGGMWNYPAGPPCIPAWEGMGGKKPDPTGPGWLSDDKWKHMVYTNWWLIFESQAGGNGRGNMIGDAGVWGNFYSTNWMQWADDSAGGFQKPISIWWKGDTSYGRKPMAQYMPNQSTRPLDFMTDIYPIPKGGGKNGQKEGESAAGIVGAYNGWRPNYLISAGVPADEVR